MIGIAIITFLYGCTLHLFYCYRYIYFTLYNSLSLLMSTIITKFNAPLQYIRLRRWTLYGVSSIQRCTH